MSFRSTEDALLKPEDRLTDSQIEKLAEVKAVSPKLALMHQHKEAFRALFDAEQWAQASLDFLDWMAEAKDLCPASVATIRRWFGEILQYFENRTTSGVVEGIIAKATKVRTRLA